MNEQQQLLFRLGFVEGLLKNLISVARTQNNAIGTVEVAKKAAEELDWVREQVPLHLPLTLPH